MKTTHRDALHARLSEDRQKMPEEKVRAKQKNKWLGFVYVVAGLVFSGVSLVLMLKQMAVSTPFLILLGIGIAVSLYGAHMIPSQTDKADAFLKDALESAASLLPGKRGGN